MIAGDDVVMDDGGGVGVGIYAFFQRFLHDAFAEVAFFVAEADACVDGVGYSGGWERGWWSYRYGLA